MATTPINCLFDTTVFIDHWRGRAAAQDIINRSLAGELSGSFSIITDVELWAGVSNAIDARDHKIMLTPFRRYPLTVAIARRAGALTRMYEKIGATIPDMIIGATAEYYNLILISRNIKHFSPLESDGLISYISYQLN